MQAGKAFALAGTLLRCGLAYNYVEAGLGISVNNQLMSSGWSGEVVVLPFDPPQEIELGVAVLGLGDASPATRAFIDCAQNWVGGNAKG